MAGLAAARARGRLGGRPRRLTLEQVKMAANMTQGPDIAVKEIRQTLGVLRSTLYRYVRPGGEPRQQLDRRRICPRSRRAAGSDVGERGLPEHHW